jgi:hypothetical protein
MSSIPGGVNDLEPNGIFSPFTLKNENNASDIYKLVSKIPVNRPVNRQLKSLKFEELVWG